MLQLFLALAIVGAFGYYLYKMYRREKDAEAMSPDDGGGEPIVQSGLAL
jgi:hypothetical protein